MQQIASKYGPTTDLITFHRRTLITTKKTKAMKMNSVYRLFCNQYEPSLVIHDQSFNTNQSAINTVLIRYTQYTTPSPFYIRFRTECSTQTKLTQFFTPHSAATRSRMKKEMSPQTALKGTPYQGLNVSNKNQYDKFTESEIKRKLGNCQDILNNPQIMQSLPDKGMRLKQKIEQLDEALIRAQARSIIRQKNEKHKGSDNLRQRLNFGGSDTSNNNTNINNQQRKMGKPSGKVQIGFGHRRMMMANDSTSSNVKIPRGLAKNLNENNLKSLLNSIQSMSINPLDDVAPHHAQHADSGDNVVIPNLKAKLYPHQMVGYHWMIKRETHNFEGQPFGGIIADEMGLGKTMQMIALMLHKHDIPKQAEVSSKAPREFKKSNCTLIVCPVSVMDHWHCEIKKHTKKGKLIATKYHGNKRIQDVERLTANYNVIITTYGCVNSEYNVWRKAEDDRLKEWKQVKKEMTLLKRYHLREGDIHRPEDVAKLKSLKMRFQTLSTKRFTKPILSQIMFTRIVLDEAHQIKNYKSKTHKAICDLRGKAHWFMTATPIQNTLDDLYAAFHFLRYPYYSNYTNWKQGILNHSKGIQRIRTLLAAIMLRRLKSDYIESLKSKPEQKRNHHDEHCHGGTGEEEEYQRNHSNQAKKSKMIQLPPKTEVMHCVKFSDYERFIYQQLKALMNQIFVGYQQTGSVGKHFSQCLKMLLQLRQSCNHLRLIKS